MGTEIIKKANFVAHEWENPNLCNENIDAYSFCVVIYILIVPLIANSSLHILPSLTSSLLYRVSFTSPVS
jgi:hypothetical protein